MRGRKECACRTISKVLTNLSLKLVSKFQKAARYNLSLFSVFINFLSLNKFDYWRIPTFFLQAGIYLFKSKSRSTTKNCEIFSKSTRKTWEWYQRGRFVVLMVNFEHISLIILVFPLLTSNKWMSIEYLKKVTLAGFGLSAVFFRDWMDFKLFAA